MMRKKRRRSVGMSRPCKAIFEGGILAVVSLLIARQGVAADLCQAVALRDVAAIEMPSSVIPKGDIDEAITQYRVNKQTGMTSFCSHGGYCFPTHVYIRGQKHEALHLTNCKIGNTANEDNDETIYDVDVDRSKNSATALRLDDVNNQFLQLGLCSACAGNAALFYVNKPQSACGILARQALEGTPGALKKLEDLASPSSVCE